MERDAGFLPQINNVASDDRKIIEEHPSYRSDPFWVMIPDLQYAPPLLPGGSTEAIFQGWKDVDAEYQSMPTNYTFTVWDPNGLNCFLRGEKFLVQWQTASRHYEVLGAQWNGLMRAFLNEPMRLVKDDTAGKAELATGDTRTTEEVDFYIGHASVEAMLAVDDEIWLTWNREKERWETFRTAMDNGGLAVVGSVDIAAGGSGDAELKLLDGTLTGETVTIYNSAGLVGKNKNIQYKWLGNRRYVDVATC